MMLKIVGWTATVAVVALLVWQTVAADPLWPPFVSSILLVVVSGLAGLRIGADSAAAYTEDLQRLNKVLAEEIRDLEDANLMLLKQIDSDSTSDSAMGPGRTLR